eukprot:COSAG01_NODE_3158_length_6489_cov_2.264945_9_plen_87_part_00
MDRDPKPSLLLNDHKAATSPVKSVSVLHRYVTVAMGTEDHLFCGLGLSPSEPVHTVQYSRRHGENIPKIVCETQIAGFLPKTLIIL